MMSTPQMMSNIMKKCVIRLQIIGTYVSYMGLEIKRLMQRRANIRKVSMAGNIKILLIRSKHYMCLLLI